MGAASRLGTWSCSLTSSASPTRDTRKNCANCGVTTTSVASGPPGTIVYSEDLRLLVDSEKHADQIRSVQVEVVPGLVQCESYVRAMHADEPDNQDVSLEDKIRARLARQDILDKPEPPVVHFVLSESCLRRVWGDSEVMREQIDYLIKLSDRPNIHLQVMPFDQPHGRRSPIGNRFTMIRMPTSGAAGPLELVYVEGEGEIRDLDDKKALAAHEKA
ncbi:DUF5753 domain-containing protein [Saccharopolyspora sp. 5N708]|uniref:DUF5753 domain-containing protein n=1 Tax=Saccharopolyspora sp. 5N708 TaxID=3457424 RepID=UPI003FD404DB